MEDLKRQLTDDLIDLYKVIRKEVYDPRRFISLLTNHDGMYAATHLLSDVKYHEGLTKLYGKKRLDLSFERFILKNTQYHNLFSSELLNNARKKLRELKYAEDGLDLSDQ